MLCHTNSRHLSPDTTLTFCRKWLQNPKLPYHSGSDERTFRMVRLHVRKFLSERCYKAISQVKDLSKPLSEFSTVRKAELADSLMMTDWP